jgi:predicted alpha/beta superfamily hydrolase
MGDAPVRASLFGTYQHELFCEGRGRSYVLSVALPENYHASDKRYPVVYILDGDVLFGMAASLTVATEWAQEAPELIAVGIGYGVDSYDQWAELRELDLALPGVTAHDVSDAANSPQPDLFLQTLREDIVPFVDRTYRTLPDDCCLYGCSCGGFFVLYTLLQQPDAFRRYMSGSGFLEATTEYLCREAGLLRERNLNLNATVYISVGEREGDQVAALHEFLDTLGGVHRPNLELSTEVYPSEGHGPAGIALTYLRGMRKVYRRTA